MAERMITRGTDSGTGATGRSGSSGALGFYFQPTACHAIKLTSERNHLDQGSCPGGVAPEWQSKSKNKRRISERSESVRADTDRILRLSQDLRGNGTHAKAVFACAAQDFWREYDLPPQLDSTQLLVNRHFHLKPLAHLLGAFPSLGVVLLDRQRTRLFDLRLGELNEQLDFFHALPRRGRGDGFAGYDGGHAERRVADEARQHFLANRVMNSEECSVMDGVREVDPGLPDTSLATIPGALACRRGAAVTGPVLRRSRACRPG